MCKPVKCARPKLAVGAGEESQIIIVSLVRSNAEGKAGFLNTTNRANVLLSRCSCCVPPKSSLKCSTCWQLQCLHASLPTLRDSHTMDKLHKPHPTACWLLACLFILKC